jgi:hypothetical protein
LVAKTNSEILNYFFLSGGFGVGFFGGGGGIKAFSIFFGGLGGAKENPFFAS